MPAGTGKTEMIAELVKHFSEEGMHSLVLTHTHAGVDALRRRMKALEVPKEAATIRTIDAWCLDLIGHFPEISGIKPAVEPDWRLVEQYYQSGSRVVAVPAIIRMLCASYDLFVVDEYQDCQIWQHEFIERVSRVVATCVFGDRMQGLFFFGPQRPVDWELEVEATFPAVELEPIPWRWRNKNEALGEWLLDARLRLLRNEPIDLVGSPIRVCDPGEITRVLSRLSLLPSTTIAISQFPKSAADLASRLGGSYTMLEEIEGKHLLAFAEAVDTGEPSIIAYQVVQYAVSCAFGVADEIDNRLRRRLATGKPLPKRRSSTNERAFAAVASVNEILSNTEMGTIRSALLAISRLEKFRLYRREAWYGILDALRLCETSEGLTLREAVVRTRNKIRETGRHPEAHTIGRLLLVKGLEFDNVVLDAPLSISKPYNAHELYVGLTRGSSSVTVVSDSSRLAPRRPTRVPRCR